MKLWIIGNGFDLYHGLKTRYADYKAFLCHYHSCHLTERWQVPKTQAHELSWTVCRGCGKRSTDCPVCKFNKLPRADFREDLWRNLEEACAIDLKRLMDEIKWDERDDAGESPSVVLLHGSLDFAEPFVGSEFYEWLRTVEETLPGTRKKQLGIEKEDLFLSFNYTRTLQEVYEIPDDHICHVHGCLKDVVDERDKTAEEYKGILMSENVHSHLLFGSPEITDSAIDGAIDYFKTFRKTSPEEMHELRQHLKTLSKYLRKDVQDRLTHMKGWVSTRLETRPSLEEVVVAGHSLGQYDDSYFDFLADAFRSVKWRFMIHCNEDLENVIGFCARHRLHGYYMPWDTAEFEHFQCPADCGVHAQTRAHTTNKRVTGNSKSKEN